MEWGVRYRNLIDIGTAAEAARIEQQHRMARLLGDWFDQELWEEINRLPQATGLGVQPTCDAERK